MASPPHGTRSRGWVLPLSSAVISAAPSRCSHGLGSWWRGHEGSQGAGGGGEVAERPPWRTLQLAAAVISAAGSRRGRAPKGFGRSPNPRRQRGRTGEGRDGGICHTLRPPRPQDSALGSLELLRGRSCCPPSPWGGSPQQFQLGREQEVTPPCWDHAARRKHKSRGDFCHFQRVSETFLQRDEA